MKTTNKHHGFP